jgi:hypothetical protein
MEPEEIRAEIERRRKRAIDLKLRETLWTLYNSHLRFYAEHLKKDPKMIDPSIKDTLELSNSFVQFRVETMTYRVFHKDGPTEGSPGSNFQGTTRTPVTIALLINDERVFEFELKRIVRYTPEMPLFNEVMDNVTCFIEGPWVTEIAEHLERIKAHEKCVRETRQAPKLQQKLREDMKRFGL